MRARTAGDGALSLRALNRATLARQMLLRRELLAALPAVERLVALQAQLARPPFIGLWSRLSGFRREDLIRAVQRRELVRGTMMRATLHLTPEQPLRYQVIEMPLIEIASRDLRRRVAEGRSLRYQLPRAVECYIETHGLYGGSGGETDAGH